MSEERRPWQAVEDAVEDALAVVKPRLRGVLHEGAFFASLATGAVLLLLADTTRELVAAIVYGLSVSLLFGTSALYHRRTWSPRARAVMRRLDHSMIFVLIAGTYTPFGLLVLRGTAAGVVLAVVWGGALAGIGLRLLSRRTPRWLYVPVYLALGWVGLLVLPEILRRGGVAVLVLVVLGGALYSLGALVYTARRPDPAPRVFGYHEVFHALTLAAFLAHYAAVSLTYG